MKIHHLNCGTFCPSCKKLLQGDGGWMESARMCCHCLLIESNDGLILVDTGFGVQDIVSSRHLGRAFKLLMQPQLLLEETALFQIDKMGFNRRDVKHIILTHLDLDHAGGISDFPMASIHACSTEIEAALNPKDWMEKSRYKAKQFRYKPKWTATMNTTESWFGFENVQRLKGIHEDILLIPLHGHTQGHCGVAIKNADNQWLFHVGDLYMDRRSLEGTSPRLLRQAENLMAMDNKQRLCNIERVKQLIAQHDDEVQVFCSHDFSELNRYI